MNIPRRREESKQGKHAEFLHAAFIFSFFKNLRAFAPSRED